MGEYRYLHAQNQHPGSDSRWFEFHLHRRHLVRISIGEVLQVYVVPFPHIPFAPAGEQSAPDVIIGKGVGVGVGVGGNGI